METSTERRLGKAQKRAELKNRIQAGHEKNAQAVLEIRTSFASKPKTVAQKKTPEQISMLEKFYQDGLLIGPGRICRTADKDVLVVVNSASAFDKQLKLEQITSWFSQRHSKQVTTRQNTVVNNTVDASLAARAVGASEESAVPAASVVTEATAIPASVPPA
ncbi:hypothetical protein CYMTET_29515 [Cymbomonas tetramitiformis]|uniref:Uncharacterized protein n=1 Tax=Cymbomonas tetramitiformis TaxID=36881 RepID=A0AAE0FKW3_9CHLO|nr:hypothetical protein CYMTET_32934 [Cymbomonas tetramitiformis]KAK3261582.1 hypothetical protein CYMTET_29515 [Cymbomonas tetramitiformis]